MTAQDNLGGVTPHVNSLDNQEVNTQAILVRIAEGVERTNELLLQFLAASKPVETTPQKRSDYSQKKSYAIAVLAPHLQRGTIPSKAEIAREVGVPVRTLSGWPEFAAAYELLTSRVGVGSVRRGTKTADGDVDAMD